MEFFVKHDETVGKAIQRIVREQIDYASGLLKDTNIDRDIAVHESRKTFKKIRSMLRLIQSEFSAKKYLRESVPYRDVGRSLSPLRDSFVLVEALDKVKLKTEDKAIRAAATVVRRALMKQYRATRKSMLASNVIEAAIAELELGRERLEHWLIERDDFSSMEYGLKRAYQRGKQAMAVAYKHEPSPELFHDWRKRVKDLWYQTLILAPIWPAVMPAVVEQVHILSEILGEAHDLAVLHQTICGLTELEAEGLPALIQLIAAEQTALEQSAQAIGKLIYAESAGLFVKRLASYWKVWRRSGDALTLYMPDPQPL
jgi:CHAD domain-containing protein